MLFGVAVDLYDRHGVAYRDFGTAEYDGPDAYDKAFAYANKRVEAHRNAGAYILINGEKYAFVGNGTVDYAGTVRREVGKPYVKIFGAGGDDAHYA